MKIARSQASQEMNLNISSLMDVLTILLIFLILSFDSQESSIKPPKDGFPLPTSTSELSVKLAVKVSVASTGIRVEDESVVALKAGVVSNRQLDGDKHIKSLLSALQKEKARLDRGAIKQGAEDENQVVYLEADRGISFETVDRVMKTAAAAGFSKFRLAVHRQS